MKPRTASLGVVFLCLIFTLVRAGEFNSVIIKETDSALTLDVPDHHFLRIRNFTQEGGSTRGVVTATVANGVAQTAMVASLVDSGSVPSTAATPESIKKVVIAGPAQITIAPVPGATLFVTYRRAAEETPTPTATPTVTPTVTPTPTVSPTPTVTPFPTPTPTP